MGTAPVQLPPPPYKSPVTTANGILTPAWSMWIQLLFNRVGGLSAPSIPTLAGSTPFGLSKVYLSSGVSTFFTSPTGVTTALNQFSITNQSALPQTLSVNIVPVNQIASSSNLVVSSLSIAPGQTVSPTALQSLSIGGGGFIVCTASVGGAVVVSASGSQVS